MPTPIIRGRKTLALATLAATLATLAACGSTPERFYTLAPPTAARVALPATAQYNFEILPVTVPDRIDRPQLVVRSSDTQLRVLEQDRWAAPFGVELRDALNTLLQAPAGNDGMPRKTVRVAVEIASLDATQGDDVSLAAAWTVRPLNATARTVCRATFTEPAGGSVNDVVAAHQRLVARLASGIAASAQAGDPACTTVAS
jgi:uncharacterized lipoprotein YmbA